MRKLYYTLFAGIMIMLLHENAFSQSAPESTAKDTSNKQLIRTAADLKSGTSQDVLTSFFKLAYSDLKDGHHLQFNSSLFAVHAKTDSTLWRDTNYKKQVFARNFTFGIDYGLDSTYKFKSVSLNIKYAIVNQRDKSIFDFSYGKEIIPLMDKIGGLIGTATNIYYQKYPDKRNDKEEVKKIDNFLTYSIKANDSKTSLAELPKGFIIIIDSLANTKMYLPVTAKNYPGFRDSITNLYNIASSLLAKTVLWTAGTQVTANQQKLFNKVDFNTEFLKGLTNNRSTMGAEIDAKANFDIYDTTAVNQTFKRKVLSASLGINWIIYKDKKSQKSYIEFKPAFTYNKVLGGEPGVDKQGKFTGDGILRFRVTDALWIPIDIKYDPDKGKFFGFLNITSNFDWLGGSKSKASASN